jgi:hypothetical protein
MSFSACPAERESQRSGSTGHLLLAALLVNREQDFLRFVDPCCEVC